MNLHGKCSKIRAVVLDVDGVLTDGRIGYGGETENEIKFFNVRDVFFIGRNLDYAMSLEGSLKLKEISYIHSDAYAAGELKHGPIAMIDENTLVVAIVTQEELIEKTISCLS